MEIFSDVGSTPTASIQNYGCILTLHMESFFIYNFKERIKILEEEMK